MSENSGYGIKLIVLLESSFFRLPQIDFAKPIHQDMQMSAEHGPLDSNNLFSIVLTGVLRGLQDQMEVFNCKVKIVGSFEKLGNPELTLQDFVSFNGPAIIYPYIREYITDISRRAALNPIFLPPVNFLTNKPPVK